MVVFCIVLGSHDIYAQSEHDMTPEVFLKYLHDESSIYREQSSLSLIIVSATLAATTLVKDYSDDDQKIVLASSALIFSSSFFTGFTPGKNELLYKRFLDVGSYSALDALKDIKHEYAKERYLNSALLLIPVGIEIYKNPNLDALSANSVIFLGFSLHSFLSRTTTEVMIDQMILKSNSNFSFKIQPALDRTSVACVYAF